MSHNEIKLVTGKKFNTSEVKMNLPLIKKTFLIFQYLIWNEFFKQQHGIFQWKYNMAYYERVADYEIFSYLFAHYFCNMRFRNVKTMNAFLIIPDVPKWNLILWWQVSHIHEIIMQTKIYVTKMISKCVTFTEKSVVIRFKKIKYK